MVDTNLQTRVRDEIEGLHRFLVDWLSGAVPDTDDTYKAQLLRRLDASFCLIPPDGVELSRSTLANGLRKGHGSNPDFRIAIRDVKVRAVCGSHVLATYVEWQRSALASKPPDNARLASVLFHVGESLQWVHVHETWWPEAAMKAGAYDF
jgi:hypothetical protein